MIYYDDRSRCFLLNGKSYSYGMYISKTNNLHHICYGGKITAADMPYLIEQQGRRAEPFPEGRMMECAGFGRMDHRDPTLLLHRKDGAVMSSFRYHSHKIVEGAIPVAGMPCIRRAAQTLAVTLRDDFSDTEVELRYSVTEDSDVLVRNLVIRNVGTEPVNVSRAFSFCWDTPDTGSRSALRLPGTWGAERSPTVTPLREGTLRIAANCGYSSHRMNPFLGILEGNADENTGNCYGVNLLYSGSFAITAESTPDGRLRVQGGINDLNFQWKLEPGETFETPQAALCFSAEGLGGLSRAYHDFFRSCIIDPRRAAQRRPVVVNNWEATYFNFDSEKLFSIIDEAGTLGMDTFVLDDGWFGKRDNDRSGLGDWFVNENKLQGGLKAVIDRCKRNGLKFGLWFEPEMISPDSDLYRAHPDWIIGKIGCTPCLGRNQLILDMSRPEVVDYVYEMVAKILSENDISYVKWDKNREMSEFYSPALPADRQGELAHRYTLGFYELARRLTENFPNVFFEGCAGGGGRFDGGALYYFPQIWTSDDTDGYERTKIQWGTSICYPLSAMSCHISACPNHQTGRITPFATRGAIASLGATGYELDLTRLSEEEKAQVRRQIESYRQIDDLVLQGDLYRLCNPFMKNYFCEMIVSKDKKRAYLVGELFRADPCGHDRVLKLQGLDREKTYYVKELDMTATGCALMNMGVLYPSLADYGSWTWHIEEVGK